MLSSYDGILLLLDSLDDVMQTMILEECNIITNESEKMTKHLEKTIISMSLCDRPWLVPNENMIAFFNNIITIKFQFETMSDYYNCECWKDLLTSIWNYNSQFINYDPNQCEMKQYQYVINNLQETMINIKKQKISIEQREKNLEERERHFENFRQRTLVELQNDRVDFRNQMNDFIKIYMDFEQNSRHTSTMRVTGPIPDIILEKTVRKDIQQIYDTICEYLKKENATILNKIRTLFGDETNRDIIKILETTLIYGQNRPWFQCGLDMIEFNKKFRKLFERMTLVLTIDNYNDIIRSSSFIYN